LRLWLRSSWSTLTASAVQPSHALTPVHDEKPGAPKGVSTTSTTGSPGTGDHDGLLQLGVAALERADLRSSLTGHPVTLAVVDLLLTDPAPQRLSGHPQPLGHYRDRRPFTRIVIAVIEHQTDSLGPRLRGLSLSWCWSPTSRLVPCSHDPGVGRRWVLCRLYGAPSRTLAILGRFTASTICTPPKVCGLESIWTSRPPLPASNPVRRFRVLRPQVRKNR
jgi:hypothetical protein